MSLCPDLRWHLWTMQLFGLLPAYYHPGSKALQTGRLLSLIAVLQSLGVQSLATFMFFYWLLHIEQFIIQFSSSTGNIYLTMEFSMCCCLMSGVNLYFYKNRRQHIAMVEDILRYAQLCRRSFGDIFLFYVALALLCTFTYWTAFGHNNLHPVVMYGFVVVFSLNYATCGCLISFYCCVQRILESSFRRVNDQLALLLTAVQKDGDTEAFVRAVKGCLREYYDLRELCDVRINRWYGQILLFVTAYMLFSAPAGPFFLVSVSFEQDRIENMLISSVISILWCCPWMFIFVKVLSPRGVYVEYNKTVRILANVRGAPKGMTKMIDKFLLINMQRKPLLSANGFFSMNRRTLFKLFTEIFTYLSILVQFKALESTLKKHQT